MMGLHKIIAKNCFYTFTALVLLCVITWKSEARQSLFPEIYSTLTTVASAVAKNDTVPTGKPVRDTTPRRPAVAAAAAAADTIPAQPASGRNDTTTTPSVDTFSLKLSKDTLDAPIEYVAEDSAVVLVQDKKIILYGQTKTTHKDIVLQAPQVTLDQQTNLITAVNSKDSLGDVVSMAKFEQGENRFESDTIQFNIKSQRGLIKNTYTQQSEMYVHGETIKKVDANTFFVRHGTFTTCNLDHPHFGFVANKLKVINNKVAISGPTHPEFEGVPVPVYLPFGYFPLSRGRHSGFLPPRFSTSEDFGVGLEGLGYYKVLSDYLDMTFRGDIYSYGGWRLNFTPTYRKRYRYNGGLNLSLQHTKFNFKGDPDYRLSKTFFITWNHSIDQRARPGTNFSANVNAGSTKFNEYIPNMPDRNFTNQLQSSISYSKTWANKPYSFSLNANHNSNSVSRLVTITLPDAGFTVTTIYPLQSKNMVGTPKWYEKLGIGYNGVTRNQFSFYDTLKNTVSRLLDTMQWGAQHRVPITLSLPPLGPMMVSPSISYEETWLTQRMVRRWNNAAEKVDTVSIRKGFFTDRHITMGIGFNTALYGTAQFRRSRLMAIRHVMRPNASLNYTPNLSRRNYDVIQVDTAGNVRPLQQLSSTIFSGYTYGRFGGMSFGIDNNLEMKWRSRKDTGENAVRKVRLIDGFGFTSGYNFLADSLSPKLQPFNLYLRSTLFEKINLTATALLDPYSVSNTGLVNYNRFVWQDGRFSPGRLTSGSISLSTDFRSKPRDGSKPAEAAPTPTNQMQITDPTLLGDQERMMDYMRRNPGEFVDFNIPWSISLSYSLYFSQQLQSDYTYQPTFNSNLNFTGSFSLTPKWNFTTNGYYDFNTMELQTVTMSISREMHCWQMSIGLTPVGPNRYFNITISPKASMLQDLRVNRTRYFTDY